MSFSLIKDFVTHIDFLAIDINKPVAVTVPIEFTGVSSAEKNSLGILVKVLYELHIEALPKNLPHEISVDISGLANVGDQIHVKDISLGADIKILTDAEEVVAVVSGMTEEKEEASAPVDLSTIEVEKKGKKEEEGGGEAETA
jgi:large subunit ribosomal protein L25